MVVISALGYVMVGVLFVLLAILLATSWRGHRTGVYLISACVLNALWAVVSAAATLNSIIDPFWLFVAEIARTTSWIVFLAFLLGQIGAGRLLRGSAIGICFLVLVSGLVSRASEVWLGGTSHIGGVLIPGGLILSLTGLVLVEQLYRNSPAESRQRLKLLVLALGGLFAYDLFLYSQAMLFSAIDATTWLARGMVNLLFIPAIAIAARRNPDWQLRIFVSRQVVFYSTTLVAVGIYLILMSFGGYLLIQFGGSWGALARTVFVAGAALVLIILLFSSMLRARAKVFLSKHFFRNKYDYREEWLRLVSTLAEFDATSTRDVAIKAIAQIVNSPSGVLWLIDERERKYVLESKYEFDRPIPDIEHNDSLVQFMQSENWLIDLDEYGRQPELYKGLKMPGWIAKYDDAWLVIPLTLEKKMLGLILLTKSPGRLVLNYEDRDLLKTVGNHIAVHLAQARSDSLLSESQQFETYNKLTAFLMHDLNNLIAQQSLIVANAEKHKRNPEFVDDAISTIASSVERMKQVMRQLKRGRDVQAAKPTEVRFIASGAADRCTGRDPAPTLELDGVEALVSANPEEFIMVLTHLIRNAQDATPEDGNVVLTLAREEDNILIQVKDTGCGMSPEFIRERMFRPFDSTKGSQGMGIGAYQAREFARRIGGELIVLSQPGAGTTVIMSLPIST